MTSGNDGLGIPGSGGANTSTQLNQEAVLDFLNYTQSEEDIVSDSKEDRHSQCLQIWDW